MRPFQLGKELVLVADETLAWVEELVKPAYPGLITQAQPCNDGAKTLLDLLGILGFQVVVDKHDHGNGNRIGSEGGDFLFDVVLKNAKFVSPEIGDQPPSPVLDRDRDHHLIHRHSDPRLRVVLAILRGRSGALALPGLPRLHRYER